MLLTKISEFIRWPDQSDSDKSPIRLCFLSEDALKGRWRKLEGYVAPTTERPFEARVLGQEFPRVDSDQCKVIFVDRESESEFVEWRAQIVQQPILTVGETPGFLMLGGMITIAIEDDRPRLDINLPPMKQAGLVVQSDLLGFARQVRPVKEN